MLHFIISLEQSINDSICYQQDSVTEFYYSFAAYKGVLMCEKTQFQA